MILVFSLRLKNSISPTDTDGKTKANIEKSEKAVSAEVLKEIVQHFGIYAYLTDHYEKIYATVMSAHYTQGYSLQLVSLA